jgi:hypothetical protein
MVEGVYNQPVMETGPAMFSVLEVPTFMRGLLDWLPLYSTYCGSWP